MKHCNLVSSMPLYWVELLAYDAIQAKRMTIVLLRKNSTGNILRSFVVKIHMPCWTPNDVNRTPESTKSAMTLPEPQE